MDKHKELAKNTIIIFVGNICTNFISFLLLPLYTSVLSTEEYGTVDLIVTCTTLLLPFVLLQIEQAIFRFLYDVRNFKEKASEYVSTTVFFAIFQSVLSIIIFLVFENFITFNYKYYLIVFLVASIWSSVMLQIARGFGDNITYSAASFFSALTQIVLNIIFLLGFKLGLEGMLIANTIGHVVMSVFIIFKLKIFSYINVKKFSLSILKILLMYSIPLIPNAISWWILDASDRFIISNYLGLDYNGLCSVAYKFSYVIITIYNIFNISWTESASIHINDEDRDDFFKSIINNMFKLFSCLCLLVIAIMPFVFGIFIDEKFMEAYNLIPIYILAAIFHIIIGLYSVIYVALKKTKEIAKTSFFAAIINIIIHLLLIGQIGVYAGALSSAIAFAIMSIYRYINIKKYLNISLEAKYNLSYIFMFGLVWVGYYFGGLVLKILFLAIVIVFCYVNNKKLINKAINMIKEKINK